jgi:urease accessory protein
MKAAEPFLADPVPDPARDSDSVSGTGLSAGAAGAAPSEARLTLGFTDDNGVTRLTDRRHFGPLRVQKALYPEHPSVCHAVIIHPPGGVVGGDQLRIDIDLGAQTNALITTPGAAKWYKANGHVSRQQVGLSVAAGAALEWLPQETIFFNQAHVMLDHHVALAADARYIGTEILCFGRTASGETFNQGRIGQHTTIRRDGKLLWWEQGVLNGDGEGMHSPLALAGNTVCATLIAVGNKPFTADLIAGLRAMKSMSASTENITNVTDTDTGTSTAATAYSGQVLVDGMDLDPSAKTGITQIKTVLVARYLGHSSAAARAWVSHCWQQIRPALLERPAIVPRIWHT